VERLSCRRRRVVAAAPVLAFPVSEYYRRRLTGLLSADAPASYQDYLRAAEEANGAQDISPKITIDPRPQACTHPTSARAR
jgi:hypothetical protein